MGRYDKNPTATTAHVWLPFRRVETLTPMLAQKGQAQMVRRDAHFSEV